MKKILVNENYYEEIKKSFEFLRDAFVKSSVLSDDEIVRSKDDALCVLDSISKIQLELHQFFKENHSLFDLFEEDFGDFANFLTRETIVELCLVEFFLFPDSEKLPLIDENSLEFSREEAGNNLERVREWMRSTLETHEDTQTFLREEFDPEVEEKHLGCHCLDCLSAYRARLRDYIFSEQMEQVEEAEAHCQQILESFTEADIDRLGNIVFQLKRQLDKKIYRLRHRLKKNSVHKLENRIKKYFVDHFGAQSDLHKNYSEKLKPLFSKILLEQNLRRDLVGDGEFARFFLQLDVDLWKNKKYLLREFKSLVTSVLALKRKDISSGILQEYLGQFWIHSKARRLQRRVIYHMGPTNSGKTHFAVEALCESAKGCYLAPLRLLAAELYDKMNSKNVKTTLLTGEEIIETSDATHYSSTIEMARFEELFDCCVIDEIQMINDEQRGWAWTRALINIQAPEVHVCGDHSAFELVQKILKMTGDTLEVKNYERMTPLKVQKDPIRLVDLERGDALIVFSRKNALKYKADLENLGFKVSIVYGRLSPEVRREQARKFDEGETDVIVATDAISMGMNLPIQRIVFSTFSKFIDAKEYVLSTSEIKQIAGRAGRFNRFPTGYVTCLMQERDRMDLISESLHAELEQKANAMVGPDLDIFRQVNQALEVNALPSLFLVEFLRLFNTMNFEKPYFCVNLKEMIEIADMVERANADRKSLSISEIFGFSCAPINLGMVEHVQYFVWILNRFVQGLPIPVMDIDSSSDNIDYLETSIKCVELYQWLARHFNDKNFDYDLRKLLLNKAESIERLNQLLSEKTVKRCSSCGKKLDYETRFAICEECFQNRRFGRRSFTKSDKREERKPGQSSGRRPSPGRSSKGGGKKTSSARPTRGKKPTAKNKSSGASSFKKYR